jgi:hypothetical protein
MPSVKAVLIDPFWRDEMQQAMMRAAVERPTIVGVSITAADD